MKKIAVFAILILALSIVLAGCSLEMTIGKGWEKESTQEQSK